MSKRSILLNQNHMYYNLNLVSQTSKGGEYTSRTSEASGKELKKLKRGVKNSKASKE